MMCVVVWLYRSSPQAAWYHSAARGSVSANFPDDHWPKVQPEPGSSF